MLGSDIKMKRMLNKKIVLRYGVGENAFYITSSIACFGAIPLVTLNTNTQTWVFIGLIMMGLFFALIALVHIKWKMTVNAGMITVTTLFRGTKKFKITYIKIVEQYPTGLFLFLEK